MNAFYFVRLVFTVFGMRFIIEEYDLDICVEQKQKNTTQVESVFHLIESEK